MRRHSLEATAIFGGIGGLEQGLHRNGHRVSLFCECDLEAIAVLERRFPGVPIAHDIKKTDEVIDSISPSSDLLTAGFPCTDLSQAGRTQGFAGGRSSLIRDTIQLLQRRPFANVLIENVPNWRHLHQGEYMREVLSALEKLGYRWAYRTLDSLAFGIPQRRRRIFVFATHDGDPREVLFQGNFPADEPGYELRAAAHGFYWTEGNRGLGWGEDCVPTLKGGSTISIPSPPAILMPDLSIVTPHIGDAERLQGFPEGWTDIATWVGEGGLRPFNARRRWMLVGNAVNVEVSTWIGEQLAERRPYDGERGTPLRPGDRWPEAAWFDGETSYVASLGPRPINKPRQPLAKFLLHSGSPLSLRATQGFYSRARRSSLRFKPGFLEAVSAHLQRMRSTTSASLHSFKEAESAVTV
jgi:DNA (cytosine-5)-methyltransferase 1